MTTPYNYEQSQELLLKALLAQQDIIPKVVEIIEKEDFENEKFKNIYTSILELNSEKKIITRAGLFKYLRDFKNISLLAEDLLLFEEPPIDNPLTLAELLKANSLKAKALESIKNSQEKLEDSFNTLEVLSSLQNENDEIIKRIVSDKKLTLTEEIKILEDYVLADSVDESKYLIPTPYKKLNEVINGGFKGGQLITIGAKTGIGKTTLASNIANYACVANKSVLYFSLEMNAQELLNKLAACHGNILLSHLRPRDDRTEELKEKIRNTFEDIRKWKLSIVDDSYTTIDHIRALAQQKAQSEDGLDMVIIDYLQLISTKGLTSKNNRQEQVAEISRYCKILANQLKVPVIVLVQLNRGDKNDDSLPALEDIRESGAIAMDSNIVLLIHRKFRDDDPDPKGLIIVDKNREGSNNKKIQVRCVLEKNIFQDISDDENITEENQGELVEVVNSDDFGNNFEFIDDKIEEDLDFEDIINGII